MATRTGTWATPVLLVAVAVALAGWCATVALVVGGEPAEMVATLALGVVGYVVGLMAAPRRATVGPLVAVVVVVIYLASSDALSGRPLAGPLDYANANAAWLVQACAAAGLAAASRRGASRGLGTLLAAAVFLVVLVTGSAAGIVTGLVVLAAVAVAALGRAPRRPVVWVFLVALALPTVAAVTLTSVDGLPGSSRVNSALSERRLNLWSDARDLMIDHPGTGVGPGRFSVESATARADPDTRAAHQALLELGAETGLPGMALGIALLGTAVLVIRRAAPLNPAAALIGATAWVALWTHAAVDYVADFPAVVATGALVAGLSSHVAYAEVRRTNHGAEIVQQAELSPTDREKA